MNEERLMQVILAPHASEKAARVADQCGQYVFRVAGDATKYEIKGAVQKLFNVDVLSVQTANVKGKRRVFKQVAGKQKSWKKAYVKLKAGQEIDFVSGQAKG